MSIKILIAPNSMKGSLDAFEFAETVAKAFESVSEEFDVRKLPVADGGDFTREVLHRHFGAKEVNLEVVDPLGDQTKSKYSLSGKVAIIEMADASGMKLVDSKLLNPMKASSFGTGELMNDAIKKGCTTIYLAIGGSATVDGGMGMMQALGFQLFDYGNKLLNGNGESLAKIHSVIQPKLPENISIKIICDVDNPLLGKTGAAAVFGPQKGATPEMVTQLENGLKNWADILYKQTGKDLKAVVGGGAAGGIAIPLLAFFDAALVAGADFILDQLNIEKQIKWADIVITGEGKIDGQTLNNKAPFAVSKMVRKYKKPVFAIAGKVENEASQAFDGIFSFMNGPVDLEFAMKNAKSLLYSFSIELAKIMNSLYTNQNK